MSHDNLISLPIYFSYVTVVVFLVSNYFPDHTLPENVVATTDAKSALRDADYCLHTVPVQVIRISFIFFPLIFGYL